MMIFSLVAMIGLEKCCLTSACLQWLCHSGERIVARGPLVIFYFFSDLRGLTHFSQDTSKRVIGIQCRPRSDAQNMAAIQGLFANSIAIFL